MVRFTDGLTPHEAKELQAKLDSIDTQLAEIIAGGSGLADGSVTTAKLANLAVTAAKVAADVATQAELDGVAAAALQRASNLSDLASAVAARGNLGLGTAATANTGDFDASGAATAVKGQALSLTGATATTRYVGATASGAPASGAFLKGDFVIDQTGKVYICTTAGSPGTWTLSGGSVTTVAGRTGDVTLAKTDVGLANVDNTSDANKPVSTAQQTALDLKAPLVSPALTGTPTVPTAAQGTNTTQAASAAYVQTEVGLLIPKSLVDAKGDIIAATADNTVARVAVGSNGQVLTADSAQSAGVKWATPSTYSGLIAAFPEPGTFFQPPMLTSNSTTGSEGLLTAIPFVLGVARTLAQLDVKVSVAGGASSVVRIGLYADAGMYPGALIYDSGDIAAATATVKSATSIGAALAAGTVYWMVCVPRGVGGAVPTMVRAAQANGTTASMFGDSTGNSGFWFSNSQPLNVGFSQSGVSGALPSTFTSTRTPISTSAIQIVGKVS